MMRSIPTLLLATTVAAALVPAASAQSRPDSPGDVVKTCDKAVKTLRNQRPAHKLTDALEYAQFCGQAGAEVTALAVGDSRLENDTLVLDNLYTVVDAWRDAGIMTAALGVAGDPAATAPSRVYAVRHLLVLVRANAAYSYGRLVAGPRMFTAANGEQAPMPGCAQGIGSEIPNRVGTALPASYAARIRSALGAIASDLSTPLGVRNAAACME
jgi:hypothetical protein